MIREALLTLENFPLTRGCAIVHQSALCVEAAVCYKGSGERVPRRRILLLLLAAAAASFQVHGKERPKGLYAVFETSEGSFTATLYEKDTPNTVRTFVALAEGTQATRDPETRKQVRRRLYDGIPFYRVVRGEMIQAGDPTGTGGYHCGFTIPDEVLPGLRFTTGGMLAIANSGQPNSGSCQFFVTVNPMLTWNGNYTIFGRIVEGSNVVESINRKPLRGDRPVTPVQLIRVTIERVGPAPARKR